MKVPLSYAQAKERLDDANARYDAAERDLVRLRDDKTAGGEVKRIAARAAKTAAYGDRCYYRDQCELIQPVQHRYSFSTR